MVSRLVVSMAAPTNRGTPSAMAETEPGLRVLGVAQNRGKGACCSVSVRLRLGIHPRMTMDSMAQHPLG
jgi:hypothetical protein